MAGKTPIMIPAEAGQRLVFGLVDPDNDAYYILQYGYIPRGGQRVEDAVWQNVKVDGNEIVIDSNNYPLVYDVLASGFYRLVNMSADNTRSVPTLIETYTVHKYEKLQEV